MFVTSRDVISMEFSNENVINEVQNRPLLWDTIINASEEDKELAWKETAD